ncbi:hypothetical protein [Streptomyces mirabilis]|uniref:hypothetical protein n=1 Tax=Streptomyces mirabilis TaxID=68239 RepID=UPI00339F7ACD
MLTLGGFWIAGRRRRNDQHNDDLNETSTVLRSVAVAARRLAGLNGAARKEDLAQLTGLVPHVEHAVTQHTGALHERLTQVFILMTELIDTPVELNMVEGVLVAATTLDDVPGQMRLTSLVGRACCQVRTTDRLIAEVTKASAEARRLRS